MDHRWTIPPFTILLVLVAIACATPPAAPAIQPNSHTTTAASALWLVAQDDSGGNLRQRRVNVASLSDLPGHTPLDLGQNAPNAVRVDDHTLAVVSWSDSSQSAVLHLIDSAANRDESFDLTFKTEMALLAFSSNPRALYWITPIWTDRTSGRPSHYELYGFELDSRKLNVVANFGVSFEPSAARIIQTASGPRFAIYGTPVDTTRLSQGVPHVLLVDLAAGRIGSDIALDGVKAGTYFTEAKQRENTCIQGQAEGMGHGVQPGLGAVGLLCLNPVEDGIGLGYGTQGVASYETYIPSLAWDTTRNLLYVVHADANKISLVDLARGQISKQADIRKQQSLLEQALTWFSATAEAKGPIVMAPYDAVLSPDGKRLFVPRRLLSYAERSATLTGIQVIATADLAEVGWIHQNASDFMLSPDGQQLLLLGDQISLRHELYLFDATTLQPRARITLPDAENTWFDLNGFSSDSRYAYFKQAACEQNQETKTAFQVLDLASQRFVGRREFKGCPYVALLGTGGEPSSRP